MIFWKRLRAPERLSALSDEELCRQLGKGNDEAFVVLFDRYWQDVFRMAHAVLRDKAEAEDFVQTLFLEVHTTMLRYDETRGSFRTLLLRSAYTRAVDHRRYLERRRYYATMQIEELDPHTFFRDGTLASGLTPEEGNRLIEEGLQYLDDKQRVTVMAYFFEGLSIDEVARKLGESHGNVRHYLYRGLERMRKVLAPKESETEESSGQRQTATLRLPGRVEKQGVAPEVSGV